MKPLLFIAALFLLSCTKQNQGLHASLSITESNGEWTLSPAASTGPIVSWTVRMYQTDGPVNVWGPNEWVPATMYFGTNFGGYDRATLIVKDNAGHSDSTVVNQQF
jgi:hypothetical protein